MPETEAPAQAQAPAAPDFKALIGEAVGAALAAQEERRAKAEADQAAAREAARSRQAAAQADADPLRSVILERVPEVRTAQLAAANALDSAKFYAAHPEAREFAAEIEAKAAESGYAFDRETIFNWYKGANLPTFLERAQQDAAAKIAAAQSATTATGAGPRTTQEPDWGAMSQEERSRLLAGVTF